MQCVVTKTYRPIVDLRTYRRLFYFNRKLYVKKTKHHDSEKHLNTLYSEPASHISSVCWSILVYEEKT